MVGAKCLMMQRDETLMLRAWLRYHAHLFGFENLVVYDNGSINKDTIELLARAERAGADVRRQHDQASDFEHRHIHFRRLAEMWDQDGDGYDLSIPLECDEFLAVYTEDGVSCARGSILEALEQLEGDRRASVCASGLVATATPNEFAVGSRRLVLYPAHALTGPDTRDTRLTCIGFGTEADAAPEARVVYQGLGKLFDALGLHDERLGAPAATARGGAGDALWVRARAGERAVRFKGSAYLKRNPDVREAGWPALLHFVLAGLGEGRELK